MSKLPRLRRRGSPPAPEKADVLDRTMWPHDYVGPNVAILGPCRIKTRWAGEGYIIRSRRDGQLWTVPREHVRYWKANPDG